MEGECLLASGEIVLVDGKYREAKEDDIVSSLFGHDRTFVRT